MLLPIVTDKALLEGIFIHYVWQVLLFSLNHTLQIPTPIGRPSQAPAAGNTSQLLKDRDIEEDTYTLHKTSEMKGHGHKLTVH